MRDIEPDFAVGPFGFGIRRELLTYVVPVGSFAGVDTKFFRGLHDGLKQEAGERQVHDAVLIKAVIDGAAPVLGRDGDSEMVQAIIAELHVRSDKASRSAQRRIYSLEHLVIA